MQPSHDANGQVVSMNMTGSTMSAGSSSVGSKLHNELSAGAHEGMVSNVTGGTAVGGVSAASVMSVGAPSSFTPSMLSGGDNYSQYQVSPSKLTTCQLAIMNSFSTVSLSHR